MYDKLMLDFGDLDEVSEDEEWERELKADREERAERAFDNRWKWLQFKGANWKRRKRRKKAGANGTGSRGRTQGQSSNSNGSGAPDTGGREAGVVSASGRYDLQGHADGAGVR